MSIKADCFICRFKCFDVEYECCFFAYNQGLVVYEYVSAVRDIALVKAVEALVSLDQGFVVIE